MTVATKRSGLDRPAEGVEKEKPKKGAVENVNTAVINKVINMKSSGAQEPEHFMGGGHDRAVWRQDNPTDFTWMNDQEPHMARRRAILEKHPEIKQLFKADPISSLFCFATVFFQIGMAYLMRDQSWFVVLMCAWVIGGTANHSLQLAMHELSHDLWFPKRWQNAVMGFIANLPTAVASAQTFRRYHLEHHTYQGSDKMDADIPTVLEGKLFNSIPGKLFFVSFQALFYAVRPLFTKPKPMIFMEIANWAVVGTFDYLIGQYFGVKALVYLVAGSFMGLGLHPIAGHFIAEHFEFVTGQETYSYYGPLNLLTYNVGYHNEHHDFPRVPGRLLPKVKEMAPEFYDMPHYDSWTDVLVGFIFYKNMNCYCRVKRGPYADAATEKKHA